MKHLFLVLVAMLLGVALVPVIASAGAAQGLDGLVTGEAESYALRVEYDIPLPAGPGTIPHTIGEIRRSSAGENAKGLAAAPTHFDAVVAGEYINPNHELTDPKQYNYPPQTECFYPGDLVNTAFLFPTNTRPETAGLPPIARATAKCSAGPQVDLDGAAQSLDNAGLTAQDLESTTLIRTIKGVDRSETTAHASAIKIAGGVVTIGGVDISGTSSVTGAKGGAATSTRIAIHDVSVAGLRFSIADDHLIVAGQEIPLGGNQAQGVVDQANAALAASACRIDVITNPGRYPQGYLFSRPAPRVGVEADGSYAGSMRAGLLVVCDLPESVTGQVGNATGTGLSPQRIQVVVGFAYSAAGATEEPGGFGLSDLTGDLGNFALPSLNVAPAPLGDLTPTTPPAEELVPLKKPTKTIAAPLLPAATQPLAGATRMMLLVICLAAWAGLTHLGITRLRRTP